MAKHGENIHRRKDGCWEGRHIKRRSENGAVWGYVYGHSYAETKELLIRKKAEAGYFQFSDATLTFAELSEVWLTVTSCGLKE